MARRLSRACAHADRRQEGATAVEYALMVGLIAAILFTVVTLLGSSTRDLFASALPGF